MIQKAGFLFKSVIRNTIDKKAVTFLLIVLASSANAQSDTGFVVLKQGDEFLKQTVVNSNYVLQSGNKTLNISNSLSLTKTCKVEEVSETGYAFRVSTMKIIDTMKAMSKQASYSSERLTNENSLIENHIKKIIENPVKIWTGKRGTLSPVYPGSVASAHNTLLQFTDLTEGPSNTNSTTNLIVSFSMNASNERGYLWQDTSIINTDTTVSNYKILEKNNASTTVQYSSKAMASYSNCNTNGVLVVDNSSGMILEKLAQSITVGYEVINGSVFLVTKRSSISETNKKLQ